MQRLALFDLDNTLIDLDAAFPIWVEEFTDAYGLGPEAFDWLIALDQAGYPHREEFFTRVREHFTLSETVTEPWAGIEGVCRTSSAVGRK
ncbi:hypothetical protein ACWEPL_59970 [Nonomuraea sp. NPDC004186]